MRLDHITPKQFGVIATANKIHINSLLSLGYTILGNNLLGVYANTLLNNYRFIALLIQEQLEVFLLRIRTAGQFVWWP